MKRWLGLGTVVALVGIWSAGCNPTQVLYAQSLPVTKTLAWDANPASDAVTNYTVRLDGTVIGNPTTPTQAFTINTAGLHTLSVTATNTWGTSQASTLSLNVVVPSAPANLRVP
mgnify:CR=1 FL=1|jgi:hypothetical protein